MFPRTSDPLPPRVEELVESIKSVLADPPDSPEARAAAVAKIEADAAELVKAAEEASRHAEKVPGWVDWVTSLLAKILLHGILDILLRILPRLSRSHIQVRLRWQ